MKKVELKSDFKLEEIEKRLIKEYENDEFFKARYRILVKNNNDLSLSDAIEVIENQRVCLNCSCLAECKQRIKGHYLNIEDNRISYKACKYQNKIEKIKSTQQNLVYSTFSFMKDLPSFKDIETNSIRAGVLNHIKSISDGASNKGLFLSGPPGVGKTFILEAFLNEYLNNGFNCAYILLNDLASELKAMFYSYDNEDKMLYNRIINRLKNVSLLIIDDIGAEKVDAFIRDDVLFPILDYRMKNNLMTCFSSNYLMEDLVVHYEKTNYNLVEPVKANRIIERIRVLSKEFVLDEKKSRR